MEQKTLLHALVFGRLGQVLMFSATLHSDEVKDIASRICQGATLVDLKARLHLWLVDLPCYDLPAWNSVSLAC